MCAVSKKCPVFDEICRFITVRQWAAVFHILSHTIPVYPSYLIPLRSVLILYFYLGLGFQCGLLLPIPGPSNAT